MAGVTERTYAAELDDQGRVVRVIVGSAEWATETLGGVWVDSHEKVGNGWETYDGGLRPPAPFPSWSWDGKNWNAPVPPPEGVDCLWDEAEGVWVDVNSFPVGSEPELS